MCPQKRPRPLGRSGRRPACWSGPLARRFLRRAASQPSTLAGRSRRCHAPTGPGGLCSPALGPAGASDRRRPRVPNKFVFPVEGWHLRRPALCLLSGLCSVNKGAWARGRPAQTLPNPEPRSEPHQRKECSRTLSGLIDRPGEQRGHDGKKEKSKGAGPAPEALFRLPLPPVQ